MDQVSTRLGRYRPERQNYAERAKKKQVRQTTNKLITERNWRGDLARSVADVIDINESGEVHRA